jgi:hypothetical protein
VTLHVREQLKAAQADVVAVVQVHVAALVREPHRATDVVTVVKDHVMIPVQDHAMMNVWADVNIPVMLRVKDIVIILVNPRVLLRTIITKDFNEYNAQIVLQLLFIFQTTSFINEHKKRQFCMEGRVCKKHYVYCHKRLSTCL